MPDSFAIHAWWDISSGHWFDIHFLPGQTREATYLSTLEYFQNSFSNSDHSENSASFE